jgi:AmmeMemoRadiSam system protein A
VLSEEDRRILLRAAREAIASCFQGSEPASPENLSQELNQPRGAFVTLHLGGRLRGCIGYIEAVKPLVDTIKEVAVKAAFQDPRFPPLTEDELSHILIEISVLSPFEPVSDPSTIEVGKHGLVVGLEGHRGLLLPQVAEEYHWDRETFLDNTAIKAGLPPNAWRHPAVQISAFTAEVFGETAQSTTRQ